MIQPEQKPSMRRQCELLAVCRSSLYYEPEPIDEEQDQAVTAAELASAIQIPADKRAAVVAAICEALERVERSRGVDNQMRKIFIEVLGKLGDKAATDTLIKVAMAQSESQNFLFNILAAQQLIKLADPKSVPAMIKGLYLFDPARPEMRMNDVAASVLVAVGKPSLQPMIETLQGKNAEVSRNTFLSRNTFRNTFQPIFPPS